MERTYKEIPDIAPGRGSLKDYTYWFPGSSNSMRNKEIIAQAINLKILVYRKDKITKKIEKYNHKKDRFEVVKK